MFAISLNRKKIAGKPFRSICRKFSIDAAWEIVNVVSGRPPFRNHTAASFETGHSPSAPNAAPGESKPAWRGRGFAAAARALSVRLSSL
ncbi:MAG TPA: hypothetical protein VFQ87_11905 [Bradyrhizobium sp.]|nr:hypothetical protein [Bradyrhizobium sp.]